ncbi:hypothetical protein ABN335_11310, partial [Providencia rettgeri]
LKSNIFLIVSCECPHRLSDKLLKSVAAFLYENQPFGRCCEEAYITFSSVRVKQFFAFSFSESLAAVSVFIALCVVLFPVSGCAL